MLPSTPVVPNSPARGDSPQTPTRESPSPHPPRLQHSPSLPNIWFPPHSGPLPRELADMPRDGVLDRSAASRPSTVSHEEVEPGTHVNPSKPPSPPPPVRRAQRVRGARNPTLLTPPLTPSSSIRTTASIESSATASESADTDSGGDTYAHSSRFLMVTNVSRTIPSAQLSSILQDALSLRNLDAILASQKLVIPHAAHDTRSPVMGVYVRYQETHGMIVVAFFDVRYAHAAKIFMDDRPSTLDQCVDRSHASSEDRHETARLKCAFVAPDTLAQRIGDSGHMRASNPTLFVAIQGIESGPAGENASASSQFDVVSFVRDLLSDHGQLMSLTVRRRPSAIDTRTVLQADFFDVRHAAEAYHSLNDRELFGREIKTYRNEGLDRSADGLEVDLNNLSISEDSSRARPEQSHASPLSLPKLQDPSTYSVPPSRSTQMAPSNYYPQAYAPQHQQQRPPDDAFTVVSPATMPGSPSGSLGPYAPQPAPYYGPAYYYSPTDMSAQPYYTMTTPTPGPMAFVPPSSPIPVSPSSPMPMASYPYGYDNSPHSFAAMGPPWSYDPSMTPQGPYHPSSPVEFYQGVRSETTFYHMPPRPPGAVPHSQGPDTPASLQSLPPRLSIPESSRDFGGPASAPPQRSPRRPLHMPKDQDRDFGAGAGAGSKENQVDLEKIAKGADMRTTVMIKNVPNRMTDKDLIAFISKAVPRRIDFLYLRMDFSNGCNVGYAFVNFITVQDLYTFAQACLGKKWNMFASEKKLEMNYANYQGKESLVEKFRNSCIMDEKEAWQPKVFYSEAGPEQGLPEPFPAPTHLRRKERSSHNRGALFTPGGGLFRGTSGAGAGSGVGRLGRGERGMRRKLANDHDELGLAPFLENKV